MPRKLTLPTLEMGTVDLYFIYAENGVWEKDWLPLQGNIELPFVSKETIDHALNRWTRPLVNQLGAPPDGMLRKLPSDAKKCGYKSICPFHSSKDCSVMSEKMPWCFEPKGITPGNLASEIVKLWKQKVYVLIVNDETSKK